MTADLISFYRGTKPDADGRYLREILSWDYSRLERDHNYIQWLFPTRRPSRSNPDAPCVTDEVIREFRDDLGLRRSIVRSFRLMLNFYGFELDDHDEVRVLKSSEWRRRSQVWLQPGNHNHVRITRILTSLRTLGCRPHAAAFLTALEDVYSSQGRGAISPKVIGHWHRAVHNTGAHPTHNFEVELPEPDDDAMITTLAELCRQLARYAQKAAEEDNFYIAMEDRHARQELRAVTSGVEDAVALAIERIDGEGGCTALERFKARRSQLAKFSLYEKLARCGLSC